MTTLTRIVRKRIALVREPVYLALLLLNLAKDQFVASVTLC